MIVIGYIERYNIYFLFIWGSLTMTLCLKNLRHLLMFRMFLQKETFTGNMILPGRPKTFEEFNFKGMLILFHFHISENP